MDCTFTLITGGPKAVGLFHEACQIGKTHGGNFRAPHHTASQSGMAGELALAAGGVLVLDDAHEFSRSAISIIKNLWRMMDEAVRPKIVLTIRWPLDSVYPDYKPVDADFMSRQLQRTAEMFTGWTVEEHIGKERS